MAANHVLIKEITLNTSASSVTFSNIPQTGYTDLVIKVSGRTNRALEVDGLNISFNTGGSYSGRRLYGSGSSTGSDTTYAGMPFMTAANATANTFGNAEFYIPNYTGSASKSFSIDGVGETNATTTYMGLGAGLWSGTAAITSITVAPESGTAILAGSTFSLYGVAAYGTTPTVVPKAFGGDIVTNDGTYWYHAFISTGAFIPQTTLSADVLVVAGGGSGGYGYYSGGGGAGGTRFLSSQSVPSNSQYVVTVGAGGTGSSSSRSNGSNSVFNSIVATGGGYGGTGGSDNAGTGGSGGGAGGKQGSFPVFSGGAGNTPVTSPSQGYSGGNGGKDGNNGSQCGGGGGGGAGGAGGNGYTDGEGIMSYSYGGVGLSTASSWLSITGLGQNVSGTYYIAGGGGGGGTNNGGYTANGGNGGGGAGSMSNAGASYVAPGNGLVNTGGGGGAAQWGGSGQGTPGNGGSGLVIIRYPMA